METQEGAGASLTTELQEDEVICFDLIDGIEFLEYIVRSEPLLFAIKALDGIGELPPALRVPWRVFEAFLASPGEEPEYPEESQATPEGPPGEPSSKQADNLEAAPLTEAGSQFFCCKLTAPGKTTVRVTYNSSKTNAKASCYLKRKALAPPTRTMTLTAGRCR
jgi:hypothetical protein